MVTTSFDFLFALSLESVDDVGREILERRNGKKFLSFETLNESRGVGIIKVLEKNSFL